MFPKFIHNASEEGIYFWLLLLLVVGFPIEAVEWGSVGCKLLRTVCYLTEHLDQKLHEDSSLVSALHGMAHKDVNIH